MQNILITEYFHILDVGTVIFVVPPRSCSCEATRDDGQRFIPGENGKIGGCFKCTNTLYQIPGFISLTQPLLIDQSQLISILIY